MGNEQVGAKETIKIGPDMVTISGDSVVIDAKHAMPEWQVREFSPMPIYFRDKKYFLRRKAEGQKPFAMRYYLEAWREGTPQNNVTFNYDEETVKQREGDIRGGHVDDLGRAGLLFLYPFLGLLWSRSKERLRRFGFEPRGITAISIFLIFGMLLLELVFAKMLIFRSLRAHDLVIGGMLRAFIGEDYIAVGKYDISVVCLDVILLLLLIADVLVRYSHHLKDEEPYWGFLEWLGAGARKRKPKSDKGTKIAINLPPATAELPPVIQPIQPVSVTVAAAKEPEIRQPIPFKMPNL